MTHPKMQLWEILSSRFNREELRTLCFSLSIDYDDLPAEGKSNKARELIDLLANRDHLPQLVAAGLALRPDVTWPDVTTVPPEPVEIPPPQAPASNPFYTGGRINEPHLFFGRERLVREMRAELKKRSSVSLVGPSQIGKSSLLYYLYATRDAWLPDPNVTLAYVDLQSVLDEEDFCETVLEKIGQRGHTLRDLKRALVERDLILLFDEMERLAEADFNPRLHDLLRSLGQEPHFAMGLATRRPLVEVFPARTPGGVSPFHNIFTVKTLGPFTLTEARAFLAARLTGSGVAFTTDEIARLLADSQGHPARLQQAARALFAAKVTGKRGAEEKTL